MTGFTLKVDPAQLTARVGDYDNTTKKLKSTTDKMVNSVASIGAGVWSGNARNTYTNKFRGLNDDISRMIKKLDKEIVQDLRTISSEYTKAENENVQKANSLPSDIFKG